MKFMKAFLLISFVLFTLVIHPGTGDGDMLFKDPEMGEID